MSDLPPPPPIQAAAAAGGVVAAPKAPAPRPYEPKFGSLPVYLIRRFCAACVDIFAIGYLVATFFFNAAIGGAAAYAWVLVPVAARSEGAFAALAGLSLGCAWIFAFVMEALVGTTVGKMLFALNVRTLRGGWAGFGRVFARNLLRPVDLLLIGPLLAAVTPKHQRLGDLVAGTVVGGSVIGPFAPMLAIGVLSALGYAQVLFGGGLTSALGVAAQASAFGPALLGRAVNVGRGLSGQLPAVAPPGESAAPASPQASASPVPAASAAPTAASEESSASPAPAPTPEPAASI